MKKEIWFALSGLLLCCMLTFWTWRTLTSIGQKKAEDEAALSKPAPALRQNLIFFPKPADIQKPRRFVEDDIQEDEEVKDAESIELPSID